ADPLFPLPANEEQAAIITRLGVDTGVVVEGPPGTGKTHTIANMVSALLAQGQRVLVTSEKAQALRVLRDQLPAGMQDLCVSITDASPKGNSDLAKSVDTMAGHRTDFNPAHADRTIADLTARRGDTVRHRAELLEQIRILREAETVVHPEIAPAFGGTLAAIARRLGDTAAEDGWVPGYARGELPVSTDELRHLLGLLRDDTPQRRSRRGQRLPDPASLPSVDTVTGLVATVRAGAAVRAGAGGALVSVLEGLPANALVRLGPVCADVGEAAAGLRMLPALSRWALESADTLLTGNGTHQWQRAVAQLTVVDAAIGHDQDADFADVHVAASVEVPAAAAAFERLAEHLAGGGAMRKLFKGTEQKDAERFGDEVLVDDSRPTTARAAAAAGHHLRFVEAAQRIDAAFRPVGMGFTLGAERAEGVGAMIGIRRACVAVDRLVATADSLRDLLSVLPPHRRPAPTRVPALEEIAARALDVAHARSAALAQAEIDTAAAALLAGVAPVDRPHETDALAQALAGGDPSAYADALALLDRARREQVDQECCDDLLARLHAVAPALADSIVADPGDSAWETRLPGWPRAWARACAASWIAEQVTPGREQRLDADLAVADAELRRLTGELAAERAWKACLQRMNAEQMQALQSYRNAVARVGKGTGKFAERFRRSAREAMVVAQSAVPAWVMPIQQVLASVPPEPNAFDVVIVDEASQADLTSAFLLWLAPRVIVVGDDKQCTPSEVASGALQPVFDRLDAELHDIPSYLRTVFTPKDSLFSVLRTRFGQVVRLREHFRCMPEIIEWSSTMFYPDAPLVPLRQFGADRLPPLRHTLVADAEVEGTAGRVVNRAEARAIAESVRACLGDPAYDRRTFGVVVLQSSPAQVELIDQELRELIDPADWTERRLRIGTAPDFQGDERHVVWLSLVAAPNAPLRALTAEGFRQSYNVAVSRAQDQLWLFHSVAPEELRSTDLRHSLLSHVLSEGSTAIDPVLTDVVPDRRHPRFESLFEQRVFLDLVARGLHVTPQVESNRRAIDLVVTGAAGRLAVECDGEAFHTTPERRAADLDREQELVRCGWTFERVRESSYHLDRDAALAPVWAALDRLGIGPLTAPASSVEQPVAPRPTSRPRPAPAVGPEPSVGTP
ncbi:MAG: AAA domain-containing protein, partial [Pseudonocardia sp.]|nr:AAA domain-containing protein [Pseudonocardia sp.]